MDLSYPALRDAEWGKHTRMAIVSEHVKPVRRGRIASLASGWDSRSA